MPVASPILMLALIRTLIEPMLLQPYGPTSTLLTRTRASTRTKTSRSNPNDVQALTKGVAEIISGAEIFGNPVQVEPSSDLIWRICDICNLQSSTPLHCQNN